VRSARKHIGWYVHGLPGGDEFRRSMNTITSATAQWEAVRDYFDRLESRQDRLPATQGLFSNSEASVRQG
jgi:tRNA-dihydrouridine synthase B